MYISKFQSIHITLREIIFVIKISIESVEKLISFTKVNELYRS